MPRTSRRLGKILLLRLVWTIRKLVLRIAATVDVKSMAFPKVALRKS